tara:strand:+ start:479 stop:2890 length:2412 start_codon:yes stop_codon:yes gene_type:complete
MKIKHLSLCLTLLLSGTIFAQKSKISASGKVVDEASGASLAFVNVVLRATADSALISGTISNEKGLFTLAEIEPGDYFIELTYLGYQNYSAPLFIGSSSPYINIGSIRLSESSLSLEEVTVKAERNTMNSAMSKKSYSVDANISQSGASVLHSMALLPGISTQDGAVQLRGNSQVMVLIDGKQTAITGFGKQNGLDNLPASAVERIEIINNPSAKYDANGNAGIINIILKKEKQEGLNGKVGLSAGLGALWVRKANLQGIRPQYQMTPKVNPSLALNYRSEKFNLFLQADNLYTETLNKNEFVTRTYNDGRVIKQQMKRNRNTNFLSSKFGFDWYINSSNSLTVTGLLSKESIKDYGDQPFFSGNTGESLRLWQFLEDEVLTAAMASVDYQHKFSEPGHTLSLSFNYTFDREDEKYFFDNSLPTYSRSENFALIADQKVTDFKLDYARPVKHGLWETGLKFRRRIIPTNMQFNPAASLSVLDTGADGQATYSETIPALYGNYSYEVKNLAAEIGLRLEYVNLQYQVDPNHNTYRSDGYTYFQPFPNARISYKLNDRNKVSLFYNRRVDRPDEGDLRIFPKYDDAEIIKVGNPALQPQFTNSFELGYKNNREKGYFYTALYHRISTATISRIATSVDASNLIYNVSQNAGRSYNTGIEVILSKDFSDRVKLNLNLNGYHNRIDAFRVLNLYPVLNAFTADAQEIYSGTAKLNGSFKFGKSTEAQFSAIYLAPDIIPQGTIDARFSLDCGVKRTIQNGKGEIYLNATDLLNTMVIRKNIVGNNFSYSSSDFYETQVIRIGYNYKF